MFPSLKSGKKNLKTEIYYFIVVASRAQNLFEDLKTNQLFQYQPALAGFFCEMGAA